MNGEPDITLTLPVPPSTNRLWRTGNGRTYKSPEYCAWLTEAGYKAALGAAGDKIDGAYAVALSIPKNRRDLGNHEKALSDLLQHVGIIKDDSHAEDIRITRDRSREDVLVRLWALPTPKKPKRKRA